MTRMYAPSLIYTIGTCRFLLFTCRTIEDSYRKQVRIDEETAVLEVLDTAGQEEYSAMREQWIRYGEGFFIVYSITSRGSFDKELTPLLNQLERVRDVDALNEIPVILFGNKLDLVNQRQVSTEEGRDMAKKLGSGFFEGSAKSFINIEESFFELVRTIRRKQGNAEDGPTTKPKTVKKGGGCQLF
eukprot:TRINITY_DN720_c0_g1_i4.p1 TRINITY_DN720_c0_g1~~TRINITY_DN720_c0_g1_i4.p1  ORF type:complete len:186 (-),score=22.91 TRINITY_DN720_c0_g1_i4:317-874(-)